MPLYDYRHSDAAPECEYPEVFSLEQRLRDAALTACPKCGGPVERLISAVNVATGAMSDGRLKELGFRKLKKDCDGQFRDQWKAPPMSD